MAYIPKSELTPQELNHSRPLNMHTHSDYPEVNSFVNQIWDSYLAHRFAEPKGKGKRAKVPRKQLFKTLLLDLYVNWCDDPTLCTAMSFDEIYYKFNPRINGLFISKSIIPMAKYLIEQELLYHKSGIYVPSNPADNRTTRIWPTLKLIEHFKSASFSTRLIDYHKNREVIIIRDNNKKQLNYSDEDFSHEPLEEWRQDLHAYNDLLRNSFFSSR